MSDPYGPAIEALRLQRDELDEVIRRLEALRNGGGTPVVAPARAPRGAKVNGVAARQKLDHEAMQVAYERGDGPGLMAARFGCVEPYIGQLARKKGWKRPSANGAVA